MAEENSQQNGTMPAGYIPPNIASKCTWTAGKERTDSPHDYLPPRDRSERDGVLPDVLKMIGNTPLIRLDKIARSEGLKCNLLAKCEFFNAGGSVKDRIALRMVEVAEKAGVLKPGDTIIEPTSGNTGIGLALVSAVKGYRCVIVMPEKMSNEKVSVLRALGAEIVRTPTSAAYNTPESHVGVAWRLKNEIPNSHILDQYRNAGNPMAHYDGTAEEILQQCGHKLDLVVVGAGTGGTVAGIGRKLKEKAPQVKVVAVDPQGSILASSTDNENDTEVTSYHVEGIGYDFYPTVLDKGVVDKWYKCNDKDSFAYAKRLIAEEGLLCGGSSGSALSAAVKAARELTEDQTCVVILPDSIRNYLTKFVDDWWMIYEGLMDLKMPAGAEWWWTQPLSSLSLQPIVSVREQVTCGEAVQLLQEKQIDQLPILSETSDIVGVVTLSNLTSKMVRGEAKTSDPVTAVSSTQFRKVKPTMSLGHLSKILDRDHYAIVVNDSNKRDARGEKINTVLSVVTSIDLLHYISSQQKLQ